MKSIALEIVKSSINGDLRRAWIAYAMEPLDKTSIKELAIGLVNAYHNLGREADYNEIEEDFEGIHSNDSQPHGSSMQP